MCLQRRDRHDIYYIFDRAATREVVRRAIESLQDRAERLSARQTFDKLVSDVARVEIGKDKHVGAPCYW